MDAKPCPKCSSVMATRRTRAFSEFGGSHIYYFLDCSRCGFGPTIAFNSEEEAVAHWSEYIFNYKPVEEVAEEVTAEHTPEVCEKGDAKLGVLETGMSALAEAA